MKLPQADFNITVSTRHQSMYF